MEVIKGDCLEVIMEKVGEILNDIRNCVIDNNLSVKNIILLSVYLEDLLLVVIFKCLVYSLIVVFFVIGNFLVIVVFKFNVDRKFCIVNNMFIVSMVVGDLFFMVVSILEWIIRILVDE